MKERGAATQKGMEYDNLRVNSKTGVYAVGEDEPWGYVERTLAHTAYFYRET